MGAADGSGAGRRIVVAGHLCLDVIVTIPALEADAPARALTPAPGALDVIGPATLAIGGCVGNTGVALHRLGASVALVGRIGDDPFARALGELVAAVVPPDAIRVITVAGGETSYSLVHNRLATDRAIQHFPGVNDSFVGADVPDEILEGAALLHVGYPPLMAALVADDGAELAALLRRARRQGVATSLDLADVRADHAGRAPVDWARVLERVLPDVDVFLPSLDEAWRLLAMDGPGARRDEAIGGRRDEVVESLLRRMLELGVAIAGLKCGADGLVVATGTRQRLAQFGGLDTATWAEREVASTIFDTDVAGTTGAGDATIAGFLFGLVSGMSPEAAITAACAVGAASTERPDGTSGIPAWSEIEARLARGWRRRPAPAREGWAEVSPGLSVATPPRPAAG